MTQSFGSYISDLRRTRSISLTDVVNGTGITEASLRKLESGKVYASKEQVFRLAGFFNVAEHEVLRLSQENRIHLETAHYIKHGSFTKRHPTPGGNGSYDRRIANLQRDLEVLGTRAVSIRLHVPAPELGPLIDSIVYCKGHELGHPFEVTLPDGSSQLQIVIRDGGREVIDPTGRRIQSLNKAWVMGINNVPVTYRLHDVDGVIYVRFRPNGLHAFTKIHQMELNNCVVDASQVFGSAINELWDRLASSDDPGEMIRQVEAFFINRLHRTVYAPPMVTYMLEHINSPLTQLANETGYSTRYLTKTFQKFIGVGPKTFQRIQRFHSVVSELNHHPGKLDWYDVVFQYGYHDQAHFIKEFRDFSGLSPQNYLALGTSCPRYLHTSN